ncbi:MAG: hypothetical protein ACI9XP_000081 [Lentimonas sp.]|jgi:hypothetical protein
MKLVLLFFGVFISNLFIAQFTPDRGKFIKEFNKVLSDYGRGDYSDFIKKVLEPTLVESGKFPESFFTQMVTTSNLILEKKIKPYPALYNYVYSVTSFITKNQNEESYNAWHNTVDKLLSSRNPRKFEDFIETSVGFFNEGLLSEASNFSWFYIGGTYFFDYEDKAIIRFQGGNLVCRVRNRDSKEAEKIPYIDSINVIKTSGEYDPILKKWEGQGGQITWQKVGIDPSKLYAEIEKYDIALKSSNFTADSVLFTTPFFDQPIRGKLNDRAFIINREEDKVYPQFNSYDNRLFIKDIKPEFNFLGGLTYRGRNIYGVGTASLPAEVSVLQQNKLFIHAKSTVFLISDKEISSDRAAIKTVFSETDSINHPGIDFKFSVEKNLLELSRSRAGIGQAPFENSYHQVDMFVPKISWIQGSTELIIDYEFGTSQASRVARFESKNYFDQRLYDQLQGQEAVHPLVAIYSFSLKNGTNDIEEGYIASALMKTTDQAKAMLLELSNLGFISYDTENKMIDILPKTENFVASRSGKRDFDNLIFISDLRPKELRGYSNEEIENDPYLLAIKSSFNKLNAERSTFKRFGQIDLITKDLYLVAVDRVDVSQAQNTAVFPRAYDITIKKNRDFDFQGYINAGKVEMDAEKSYFNYDEFKFKIDESNQTVLRVKPLTEKDGNRAIEMVSKLTGITGSIQVDDPKNRSGKGKGFTGFPKLTSDKNSYIYYNSNDIYKGAYDSTRFFYTVEPFLLDSLDDFKESTLRLKGELTSAGIFPVFKQEVQIMPDYSFGFSTTAPVEGYTFYGTKAKYENKIVLSNNGLQGSGKIEYLYATADSKAFSFLPDSTVGIAQFENKQVISGVQFPSVSGESVFVTYVPKKNVMKAKSGARNDLQFFGKEAILKGTAFVTPEGMSGKGLMNLSSATLVSEEFKYKAFDIDSDTSFFNLRNEDSKRGEDNVAFQTENVKAQISFKDRKGQFVSNDGLSVVIFPVNQYKCKMDGFNWYMDTQEIEMESDDKQALEEGVDFIEPNFFSTNSKTDTLSFKAPLAKFSLKEKVIFCDEVQYIDVADARVFPSDKKITIRKAAILDPLENAKIVANYITKYHQFVDATVQIAGRKDYQASGVYPYFDADSTLTNVVMEKIYLDSSFQTVAKGKVTKEMNFHLSKEFDFYGEMIIKGADPTITFTGATKINHDCAKFERSWLSFSAPIDPSNVQIPVSQEMKNLEGIRISAGIVWRDSPQADSVRIYPTFLSQLVDQNDPIVISSSGVLQYDFETNEFQIGSKAKFLDPSEKGNIVSLNSQTCALNGSGKLNLGMDFGEMTIDTYGDVNYDQSTAETSMDVTMKMTLPVDKNVFEDVAIRIGATPGLEAMDLDNNNLERALKEWSDIGTSDKFKTDYTIKGEVKKLPDAINESITITGLKLKSFDKNGFQERGIVTSTTSAVLVNIFEKPVFKYVDFSAFFMQTYSEAGSDKWSFLLSCPGGRVYFLDYTQANKDGELRIISGDKNFVSAIDAIKEDNRKSKNFKYGITKQNVYLAKFKRILGIRE